MAKRTLYRSLVISSPRGNVGYDFYRDMKGSPYGEDVPLVIVLRHHGHETTRKYIRYEEMNEVMLSSIMRNFKSWCHMYVLNSADFDPATDRVIEA